MTQHQFDFFKQESSGSTNSNCSSSVPCSSSSCVSLLLCTSSSAPPPLLLLLSSSSAPPLLLLLCSSSSAPPPRLCHICFETVIDSTRVVLLGINCYSGFNPLVSSSDLLLLLQGRTAPPPAPPAAPVVYFWHRGPSLPPQLPPTPRPSVTSWGAPVVWASSPLASRRRARFAHAPVRVALVTLVVGSYSSFLQRLLSSAETHFLPRRPVTYYVLTDRPGDLQLRPLRRPGSELHLLPVGEVPGWERLHLRRMPLLQEALRGMVEEEDYVFCVDVDVEFVGEVGEEVLDELVGVLHADFYRKTRDELPFEKEESAAAVTEDEGEVYFSSELYGGALKEVLLLTQSCSLLLLQDQAHGLRAERKEEAYLNRYFIDHAPSCVLSPQYSGGEGGRVRSERSSGGR